MQLTKQELIKLTERIHYFDQETMEFWGSEILSEPNEKQLFIEAIDDFYATKKLYMVKCVSLSGEIITVEPRSAEPEHFPTKEAASEFRDKITRLIPFNDISHCDLTYDAGVFKLTNAANNETIYLDVNKMKIMKPLKDAPYSKE